MNTIVTFPASALLAFSLTFAAPGHAQDRSNYGPGAYSYGTGYGYGPPAARYVSQPYGYALPGYDYMPSTYSYRPELYGSRTINPDYLPAGTDVWWRAMDRAGRGGNGD
jgi:hypothetical protein